MPMTIQEQLVEKLRHLSPADQQRLLDLATRLEQPVSSRSLSKNLRGRLAGLGPAPSEAEIAEIRREAWTDFPRDLPK